MVQDALIVLSNETGECFWFLQQLRWHMYKSRAITLCLSGPGDCT